MSIYRFLPVLFLTASLFFTGAKPAEATQCSYFNETFTGTASNTWSYNNGTWAIKSDLLNVTAISGNGYAYARSSFSPASYFTMDVAAGVVSLASANGAFGFYIYTTGTNYLSVDGKSLEGVAVDVWPDNTATLSGWDVNAREWHMSSKLPIQPANFIGLEFSAGAVTLRLNKQSTSLKFSTSISAPSDFNKIDLYAQGSGFITGGTSINFDNICADPLPTPVVSTGTVTLVSPADGATSQSVTPTLSWSATGSPTAYRIFAATDENTLKNLSTDATTCSGCVVTANTGTTTSYTFASGTLQPGTKYYWRVKAGYSGGNVLSGSTWSFTTGGSGGGGGGGSSCTATIDQALKLNIPVIKYTDQLLGNIYLWADMDYVLNPSKVLFKLKDYGMIQNVSGYTCTMSTIDSDLTIHVNELLYGGVSYWLKLSLDSGLSSGNNLYFKAADYGTGTGGGGGATGVVTLLSPANGATSQSLTPTLSWSATGSPTAYRIFIATDESTLTGLSSEATTCSGCVLTTNTSATASYTFSSGVLQAGTKYYWRVKAGYSSGSVLSGDIWSFTTIGSGGTGATFTLMTNPTDGQILSAKGSSGTTVRYYGDRDADGIPTSIDRIQVESTDSKTVLIELDSAKRPAKMRTPDGVVFELTYNGKLAVVTATSADGSTIANTVFTPGQASTSSNAPADLDTNSINEPEVNFSSLFGDAPAKSETTGSADWVITVKRCDVAVENAMVEPYIYDSLGTHEGNYPFYAKHIGGGKYVANIPTNLKPPLNHNQILHAAKKIEGYLNNICDVLGQASHPEVWLAGMCPAIGIYLAPITGPVGPSIGTACGVVSTAVTTYCATLGMSGPPKTDSLAQKIIEGLMDPELLPDKIRLRALAYVAGKIDMYSEFVDVSPSGPFPPITISSVDSFCDSLLDGTWSGTWNVAGIGTNGCNYTDGGNITITLSHDGTLSTIYTGSVSSAEGIHYLYGPPGDATHPACSLSHIEKSSGGQASANRTGESVNVSFYLPHSKATDRYTGTLRLINNGNTLVGNISAAGWSAVGSITLTRL